MLGFIGLIVRLKLTIENSSSPTALSSASASMANLVFILTFLVNFGVLALSTSERCLLPPLSGSCDPSISNGTESESNVTVSQTTQTRYYYSTVNYNCAAFPYSGCGGNENNFETFEECKSSCGSTGKVGVATKIKSASNDTKCWYKDQLYAVGEKIDATTKDNACSVGCLCSKAGNGEPRIACAAIDCPPPPRQKKNCVPIYKQNSCCPSTYSCDDSATKPGNATEVFKCKYLGKEYVEGESIYPDDYPCYRCTCNRNFTGEINTEVCHEVNCGIEIHHQAELANQCEPEYYKTSEGKTLCCPISWKCKQQTYEEEEEEKK